MIIKTNWCEKFRSNSLALLKISFIDAKISNIYDILDQKIFIYTDEGIKNFADKICYIYDE